MRFMFGGRRTLPVTVTNVRGGQSGGTALSSLEAWLAHPARYQGGDAN